MKKKHLTLVFILKITTVLAQEAYISEEARPIQQSSSNDQSYNGASSFNFSGWYIGCSVGYSQTHVKSIDQFQTDYNVVELKRVNGLITRILLSGRNIRGVFNVGSEYQQESLYLGFEGEATLQNVTSSQTITSFPYTNEIMSIHSISATLKDSYSFCFKSGYIFNSENLLYMKIGPIYSR